MFVFDQLVPLSFLERFLDIKLPMHIFFLVQSQTYSDLGKGLHGSFHSLSNTQLINSLDDWSVTGELSIIIYFYVCVCACICVQI